MIFFFYRCHTLLIVCGRRWKWHAVLLQESSPFNYTMRWLLTGEQEIASEAVPSVSPTLWPTEHALWESMSGRHPEQDLTLPDIKTHLQSIVAPGRSEPDPHFKLACNTLLYSACYLIFPFMYWIIFNLIFTLKHFWSSTVTINRTRSSLNGFWNFFWLLFLKVFRP